jgi:hypothetical protein
LAHPDLMASAQKEYRGLKSTVIGRLLEWMSGENRRVEDAVQYLTKMRINSQVTECDNGDDGGAYQATIPLDLLATQNCADLLNYLICLNGDKGRVDRMTHTIHKRPDFEAEIVLQRVGDDLFQVFYRCSRQGSYY